MTTLDLEEDTEVNPYYIYTGSIDDLNKAAHSGLLRPNVPVLLDDITPSRQQTGAVNNKGPMHVDTLKHLTNITGKADSAQCRNSNAVFALNQSRIFTSNAETPHEWFNLIPRDLQSLGSAARKDLGADVLAILKRCVFAVVQEPLIHGSKRKVFNESRNKGVARKLRRITPAA